MYNIGFKVRITTVNAILCNYVHIAEHSGKADCVSDVCFRCVFHMCTTDMYCNCHRCLLVQKLELKLEVH